MALSCFDKAKILRYRRLRVGNRMRNVIYSAVPLLVLVASILSQPRNRSHQDFYKFVTNLPEVDRVNLFEVEALQTDQLKTVDCSRPDLVCCKGIFPLRINAVRSLVGADAARLAALWRKLEWREPGRCFFPNRVLRFYRGGQLVLETPLEAYNLQIKLPNEEIVFVSEGTEAEVSLRDFLISTDDNDRKASFENHKSALLPRVNHQVTLIGFLDFSKPGYLLYFNNWGVFLRETQGTSAAKRNALARYECQVIKVTGTLRYWPPSPPQNMAWPVQQVQEHFYLDINKTKIVKLYPPPGKRANSNR